MYLREHKCACVSSLIRALLQVYDRDASQKDIYDTTGRPIVEAVLNGYNGDALKDNCPALAEGSVFYSHVAWHGRRSPCYLPISRPLSCLSLRSRLMDLYTFAPVHESALFFLDVILCR
jgi:hypothetical protein